MKWIILAVCTLHFTLIHSQFRIEQVPLSPVKSNTGFFLYGVGNFSTEIPYSSITGSPFWKDEFSQASIIDKDGRILSPVNIKINLATNQIHFLDSDSNELTVANDMVDQVIVYTQGATINYTIFRKAIPDISSQRRYAQALMQELNNGGLQLLKISRKVFTQSDSLFGTKKKYAFVPEEKYFLKNHEKVYALRKLSRKEIYPVLVPNKTVDAFIERSAIDFTKEADVVRLLLYMNQQTKSESVEAKSH